MDVVLRVVKWIIILVVFLFSVATLMAQAYFQTATLLVIVVALIWWPYRLTESLGFRASFMIRSAVVILLAVLNIFVFKPDPKNSVYLSEMHKDRLYDIYDEKVKEWPVDVEDIWIDTEYGKVHVLASGDTLKKPILLLHAALMGAHSWAENLEALKDYRIYAIDNIGEGNKSELNDVSVFPQNGKDLADLYKDIADSLGVVCSPVIAASNGGFIALNYSYYFPEKVDKLVLLGSLGFTDLSSTSMMIFDLAKMYPFPFVRDYVSKWAIGNNEYVNAKYGNWVNYTLESTNPSVSIPEPLTSKQKENFETEVLLFLGNNDALVGDVDIAKEIAQQYPNIKVEVLESGHLIGIEKRDEVNIEIKKFLDN